MRYKEEQIDTIVLAGKDYGMGSSRDRAAKELSGCQGGAGRVLSVSTEPP